MTQSSTIDRKEISSARRAARDAEQARGEVLVGLMSRAPGRAWVWGQLEAASVFSSTYNDSPTRMAFAEGQRTAGLRLLGDLMQWCPDLFIQAMREANERRSQSDSLTDASVSTDPDSGEYPGGEEPRRDDQGRGGGDPSVDPDTGAVIWN